MDLTPALENEYQHLWNTCEVRPERRADAENIAGRIVENRKRYEGAGHPLGVPWYVVGVIHQLEGSGNFHTHLHNGDPLTARTVREPAGRPANGSPPFTWEFSAADALVHDGLNAWHDWSIPGTLFVFERFNGFGYRKSTIAINSPYLWSFSKHYTQGKFIADNVYSPTAVSAQCGAAVLLLELAKQGLVAAHAKPSSAPGILKRGDSGPAVKKLKRDLEAWFNANAPGQWAGFGVAEGGHFGAALEKAVKVFQARNHLEVDGKVGKDTREALAAAVPA